MVTKLQVARRVVLFCWLIAALSGCFEREADTKSLPCTPGLSTVCYTGPLGSRNVGPCQAGLQLCSEENGKITQTCFGQVLPGAESCNGVDDDCNGATDDGAACTQDEMAKLQARLPDVRFVIDPHRAGPAIIARTSYQRLNDGCFGQTPGACVTSFLKEIGRAYGIDGTVLKLEPRGVTQAGENTATSYRYHFVQTARFGTTYVPIFGTWMDVDVGPVPATLPGAPTPVDIVAVRSNITRAPVDLGEAPTFTCASLTGDLEAACLASSGLTAVRGYWYDPFWDDPSKNVADEKLVLADQVQLQVQGVGHVVYVSSRADAQHHHAILKDLLLSSQELQLDSGGANDSAPDTTVATASMIAITNWADALEEFLAVGGMQWAPITDSDINAGTFRFRISVIGALAGADGPQSPDCRACAQPGQSCGCYMGKWNDAPVLGSGFDICVTQGCDALDSSVHEATHRVVNLHWLHAYGVIQEFFAQTSTALNSLACQDATTLGGSSSCVASTPGQLSWADNATGLLTAAMFFGPAVGFPPNLSNNALHMANIAQLKTLVDPLTGAIDPVSGQVDSHMPALIPGRAMWLLWQALGADGRAADMTTLLFWRMIEGLPPHGDLQFIDLYGLAWGECQQLRVGQQQWHGPHCNGACSFTYDLATCTNLFSAFKSVGIATCELPGQIELCNGLDDDCDGLTDEDANNVPLAKSCYGGPPGTLGVGICQSGTSTCIHAANATACGANETLPPGAMGCFGPCIGETLPEFNCSPTVPLAICSNMLQWTSSLPEVSCDQLDSNCNKYTDDGAQEEWAFDADGDTFAGGAPHQFGCKSPGAHWIAYDPTMLLDCDDDPAKDPQHAAQIYPKAVEICDNLDNNCKDGIDEGCPCPPAQAQACGANLSKGIVAVDGICAGEQICIFDPKSGKAGAWAWSNCFGTQIAQPEQCNGADDDCDGLTDEDIPGMVSVAAAQSPPQCPPNAIPCGAGGCVACVQGAVKCVNVTALNECGGSGGISCIGAACDGAPVQKLGFDCGTGGCGKLICASPNQFTCVEKVLGGCSKNSKWLPLATSIAPSDNTQVSSGAGTVGNFVFDASCGPSEVSILAASAGLGANYFLPTVFPAAAITALEIDQATWDDGEAVVGVIRVHCSRMEIDPQGKWVIAEDSALGKYKNANQTVGTCTNNGNAGGACPIKVLVACPQGTVAVGFVGGGGNTQNWIQLRCAPPASVSDIGAIKLGAVSVSAGCCGPPWTGAGTTQCAPGTVLVAFNAMGKGGYSGAYKFGAYCAAITVLSTAP